LDFESRLKILPDFESRLRILPGFESRLRIFFNFYRLIVKGFRGGIIGNLNSFGGVVELFEGVGRNPILDLALFWVDHPSGKGRFFLHLRNFNIHPS